MEGAIAGFDWDEGNREKCQKHGVTIAEIEALFRRVPMIRPDLAHSHDEQRFLAVGQGEQGRFVFLAFTIRERDGHRYLRPISARYMHQKEVERHGKENPRLSD